MSEIELHKLLDTFEPISLEEMDVVKLMNRVDTKYIASRSQLADILRMAQKDYFAQQIDGKRITQYDTLYYDTPELSMYIRHHDRHLVRQKVRIRTYVDSDGLTFLEIKDKNNKGKTKKKRIAVSDQGVLLHPDEEVSAFMTKRCWYEWRELLPELRTAFSRITLVNKGKTERLTIDLNLVWSNVQTGIDKTYEDLVIIELKRDGNTYSPMLRIMNELRIKPMKISKYCVGTALTNESVKRNRFKAKIRKIERITNHTTI